MSIKFARRAAAEILNRGESAIRFNKNALEEIKKAITKDDIRRLIQNGSIFAVKAKHNLSLNSKLLKKKREEGRRRGFGRRKGTRKARGGITWEKKVRSQRALLTELKKMGKLDSANFKKFYMLIKGNAFPDKASLLLHLKEHGITVTEDEKKKIDEALKMRYK
ncbi:MAG: 50S ribosomal protein L19e [Candidatus Micrarchaeia archaeon]|jgi:large subunit ribosomal protein L19e